MKLGPEEWLRLVQKVRAGEPLPKPAREFVANALNILSRGEDAREFAGTKPKHGRPKDARAIVGMHYWLLRAKYGRGGELAARNHVAEIWELSPDHVRKIGKNTRSAFEDGMTRMVRDTPDQVDFMLASFAAEAPNPRPRLRLVKK